MDDGDPIDRCPSLVVELLPLVAGYDLDDAFDKYFANPTEVRPPTVYIGFPCTKVSFLVTR